MRGRQNPTFVEDAASTKAADPIPGTDADLPREFTNLGLYPVDDFVEGYWAQLVSSRVYASIVITSQAALDFRIAWIRFNWAVWFVRRWTRHNVRLLSASWDITFFPSLAFVGSVTPRCLISVIRSAIVVIRLELQFFQNRNHTIARSIRSPLGWHPALAVVATSSRRLGSSIISSSAFIHTVLVPVHGLIWSSIIVWCRSVRAFRNSASFPISPINAFPEVSFVAPRPFRVVVWVPAVVVVPGP